MKTKSKIIIAVVAVLVIGIAIAAFFIVRHNSAYISKSEALEIATQDLATSGVTVLNADVEFEKGNVTSFYDIEFETSGGDYECKINAATGEILYSGKEIDN